MLVVTRNEGQALLVGDAIKLTELSIRGGQLRFAVQAPPEVVVLRHEVAERGSLRDKPGRPPRD